MATSGTFAFAPSIGECVLNSLSRLQIRGSMVKSEHLHMATMEANLMQVEWSNRGPNLWTVDEQAVLTVPGQSTYSVPPETIMVLEVTLGLNPGQEEQEILLTSISRAEYMSYPRKTQPGRPTVYWFDHTIAPSITLWPVPDQVYSLNWFRYRQIQDAVTQGAGQFETPYRFLDAAVTGMTWRLAVHYAPGAVPVHKPIYDDAYRFAANRDVEMASVYISPQIEVYFPR
jgi:hypothetical protein